ncbi:YfiT family bacillithiol transferase [Cyclobacterium sp.]|uniref:YfiT family bacillithiol transferase n=1 Tax=Cyclobacterium sp. TaxID=1966343 RepID=UPI0019A34072|nr:putative metal-dependent hydrolase [Cyclobacterium sp.]MBD3627295.1 putative metal-dependent hydrolase [Cyclobacterium sp.]
MNLEVLKYPLGRFQVPETVATDIVKQAIQRIEHFPKELQTAASNLPEEMLESKYRPAGWSIRQLVHHLADSHMNAYMRFKLALTEEKPVIKPYKEDLWAKLADSKLGIENSVQILVGIHEKWVFLMQNMSEGEWNRCFFHPEQSKFIPLNVSALLYAWHGKHHLAHISQAKKVED